MLCTVMISGASGSGSRFWRAAFRFQYRILAVLDPLVRRVWRRRGIGNVVELAVERRGASGSRSRLVGLLSAQGRTYVGHPNGDVGWTRDLDDAGRGEIRYHNGVTWRFRATRLRAGDEREREQAIRSTGQHPFPGNLVYRLGRRQVRAVGVFFRLEERS
jgi:hypothetical protein